MTITAANTVKVGLIGTGFMGKCHAFAFRTARTIFDDLPPIELVMLCDADLSVAKQRAVAFGFAHATARWQDIIENPNIDIVAITAPNALHRDMAIAAAEAGKAIYCEKPMALTLSDAEAMAAAALRHKVPTLLGYNYIRNPAIAHAKRLIDDGAIGQVIHFRGTCDEDYMADATLPFSWRCRIADAGTGTLGDLAVHLVSVAHFLIGPIDGLIAQTNIVHDRRPVPEAPSSFDRVENEDIATALVHFKCGISGLMTSSRVAWGRKNHLTWEVHGDRGLICFDQERMNELRLFRADGPTETRGFTTILTGPNHPPYGQFVPAPGHGLGFNDLKIIEVAHLIRGISGRETLYPDFNDGLKIEEVIHGIVQSSQQRCWISI